MIKKTNFIKNKLFWLLSIFFFISILYFSYEPKPKKQLVADCILKHIDINKFENGQKMIKSSCEFLVYKSYVNTFTNHIKFFFKQTSWHCALNNLSKATSETQTEKIWELCFDKY